MAYRFCGERTGNNELRFIKKYLNLNALYEFEFLLAFLGWATFKNLIQDSCSKEHGEETPRILFPAFFFQNCKMLCRRCSQVL